MSETNISNKPKTSLAEGLERWRAQNSSPRPDKPILKNSPTTGESSEAHIPKTLH